MIVLLNALPSNRIVIKNFGKINASENGNSISLMHLFTSTASNVFFSSPAIHPIAEVSDEPSDIAIPQKPTVI